MRQRAMRPHCARRLTRSSLSGSGVQSAKFFEEFSPRCPESLRGSGEREENRNGFVGRSGSIDRQLLAEFKGRSFRVGLDSRCPTQLGKLAPKKVLDRKSTRL